MSEIRDPADSLFEEVRDLLLPLLTERFGIPEAEAERLVNDCMILYRMSAEPLNAKQWLLLQACDRAAQYLRLRGLPEPSAGPLAPDEAAFYRRAVESLPRRAREAFLLHRRKGMQYPEIAAELGISTFAAEQMVKLAWKKVQKLVRERKRT